MPDTQQPSKTAFINYWKHYGVFGWAQVLWYVGYVGGLALYAFVIRKIDPDGLFLVAALVSAAGYIIFVPYLSIRRIQTKFASFIRCPHCGDLFGQDASGAYFGQNPKFRAVIETGKCFKCGAQILSNP